MLPDPKDANGDNTPTKGVGAAGGFSLAHSNTLGSKLIGNDFSSLHRKIEISTGKQFGGGFKKLPSAHNLHVGSNAAA